MQTNLTGQLSWPDPRSQSMFSEGESSRPFYRNQDPANDKSQPVIIFFLVNKQASDDTHPFSERNYLRYFRKIYESKGWKTFDCTASNGTRDKFDHLVESMMAAIESHGLHENPLFLHLLGDQSVLLYNQFTKAKESEASDVFRIQGTIIDSAPSRPKGLVSVFRKTFPFAYSVYLVIMHIIATIFPEFFSPPTDSDCYEQFCYNTCASPQLFLYSSSDHLVSQEEVETVMNIRNQAGVTLQGKCWTDTEHARHLFSHEHEYTTLCQEFVERNIKSLK